jgi:Spy/CpxP family protein refolding chaperone
MKLLKILPILVLFSSLNFYAQGEKMKEKREQIRTMKVAFLTTELDLTSAEAEKFWPVYNAFEDKQFELRHQKMGAFIKKIKDGSVNQMTEKEASTFLNQMESNDEEIFMLRKKLTATLRNILPASKILKLKKSEEDFNRKLLHQYRDRGNKKE